MESLRLLHFHSSSTSFRVRAALELKGLSYEAEILTLRWEDGDHDQPAYRELNPQANVPLLIHGDVKIAQSLAICDYLDRAFPARPLLPSEAADRAFALSLATYVACEIQPLGNLRVERHLARTMALDAAGLKAWRRHWQSIGFDAIERMLAGRPKANRFTTGDEPGLADCFLVPQVNNSRRPTVDLDTRQWPRVFEIYQSCLEHPAFDRARPEVQPGYAPLKQH